ncbi:MULTISPECIES: HEPN domain-containing protein [Dolosigranulum]|uniref:HEPN domain-containing protein n=1 Tax=Dolosigranulum savutiense TaxID=3110288 RepID=A0AB74U257_9LACT|nr:HEPN domain-containing protein [Dolosigranulum pigrum]QTJ38269.1 hypothetical protein FE324_05525 [Dolosigranulum pigrum]QTJ58613.1 hypothetical protein FE336_04900 [Dolosigranulum pigrum]
MKEKCRLDKDFEKVGLWTLPNYSFSSGISGKIIYNNNSLKLEIYGDLNDIKESDGIRCFGIEPEKEEVIIGFTQDGYTVIIEDAYQRYRTASYPGMVYTEYIFNKCILMKINYCDSEKSENQLLEMIKNVGIDNIPCSSCKFSIRDMNLWMNSSEIHQKIGCKSKCIYYDLSSYDIDYFYVHDDNLVFSNDVVCKSIGNSLSEEYFWKLTTINSDQHSLSDYKTNIDSFKSLLQLFIDSPTQYSFIDFEIPMEGYYKNNITAHYIYSQFHSETNTKVRLPYNVLSDKLGLILENWFKKKNKLSLIIDNYLNDINNNYFSEAKLLNAIKNLEIYHRNFKDNVNNQIEDEGLESYKKDLIEYINNTIDDPKFRGRFISNIEYYPETSLRKRLSDLFKNLPPELIDVYFKLSNKSPSKSIDSMINRIVQTRHYYTHGDDITNFPKCIIDTIDQIKATNTLNQIVKYYIYEELGILDAEVIKTFIKENPKYYF